MGAITKIPPHASDTFKMKTKPYLVSVCAILKFTLTELGKAM